jgi:hypothetical protein
VDVCCDRAALACSSTSTWSTPATSSFATRARWASKASSRSGWGHVTSPAARATGSSSRTRRIRRCSASSRKIGEGRRGGDWAWAGRNPHHALFCAIWAGAPQRDKWCGATPCAATVCASPLHEIDIKADMPARQPPYGVNRRELPVGRGAPIEKGRSRWTGRERVGVQNPNIERSGFIPSHPAGTVPAARA